MTISFHASADAALAAGRLGEAIGWLERACAEDRQDFRAWMKLSALYRRDGAGDRALAAVNSALDVRPNEFLALLLKGSLHEQINEAGRAAEVYRAALHFAAEAGDLPASVQQQLDRARSFLQQHRAGVEAGMAGLAGLDAAHGRRAQRFLDNVMDRRPVYHQEPTHYRYPGLPSIEYFDDYYPELQTRLRQAFPDIRAEYEALAERHANRKQPYVNFASGQPTGQWAALNRSPDWNVFHLIRHGEVDPVNAAQCPRTLEAMAGDFQADIPGVTPNLLFSLLAPQTRIPPHHGVANFRVLLHLPLVVPQGCQFRVGADTRTWIEGEPWIFDDTIEHEAWNESDDLRVIMIGDLWHPHLDLTDRATVREFSAAQAMEHDLGNM